MVSITYAHNATNHCSVEFKGTVIPRSGRCDGWMFSVDNDLFYYKRVSGDGDWKVVADTPHSLRVAAACLCAGLMPPSYFADLLEDHRPDLSEVAAFLREWERLKGEQK